MNELEIGDKKKALILLVGPPASGKSTWGKKFAQENNLTYVSTDAIRAEIGTGEHDQTVSAAAWGIGASRVSKALSQDKSVMIDATNTTKRNRKNWTKLGRNNDAYIVAIVFEVPKEELYRRDAQRERHIGKEIIDRFVDIYQRPDETEVDKIIFK